MIRHFAKTGRKIGEKTIWKFFCQITSGLEHMHSKRIMHRGKRVTRDSHFSGNHRFLDIKPANIFVTAEGIVRLGDLGLSSFDFLLRFILIIFFFNQGRFFGSQTQSTHSMVGTP